MIRTFLPSDLAAMLLQGGSLPNKAKTKNNLTGEETRFFVLASLFRQWIHPRLRKCLWVEASGLKLQGLASARDRSSNHAWEIDRLLIKDEDIECCLSLLEKLSLAGLQHGVEKVFLRLPSYSPLVNSVQEVGFLPYLTESLYGLETVKKTGYDYTSSITPRRKQIGDEYRLFELYENCTPVPVRRFEGMTFNEWQNVKDRMAKSEWVFEQDGSLIAWLRIESKYDIAQFELMVRKEDNLEQILTHTLIFLESYLNLLCLTPAYQGDLIRLLQGHGFTKMTSYIVFTKELTVKAKEPLLIPIGA